MGDAELEKLYAAGQSTSNAAALRAVFNAGFESGRKSVVAEFEVAATIPVPAPAAVKAQTKKPAAPVAKTKKRK